MSESKNETRQQQVADFLRELADCIENGDCALNYTDHHKSETEGYDDWITISYDRNAELKSCL